MSLSRKALALVAAMLMLNCVAWAQDDDLSAEECERLNHQKAPTIYGGTGLFQTYTTRTLESGEYSVGFFWNNMDREPGDIDINQATANFTLGLTDGWEIWANLIAWQQTTVRQPFLISGTGFNAVRAFRRSPYDFFGPPFGGTDGGAAFFPGTGALGGGILPVLGRFGTPITPAGVVIIDDFGQPAGAVGLGPAIVTDRPSYYPDLPFVGQVDFFGFDQFGRPVFGPRASGNGMGDASLGTKIEIIDPDENPGFSMALGGTVTIPTARNANALARGRTAGEVDFGPFLAFGHEFADGKFRMYENVSYTWVGDPNVGDVEILDRPDKLGLNFGLSAAPSKHVELIGELVYTRFMGGQTPNLNQRDPLDLIAGARFFFFDGQLSFGGAYRRLLNGPDEVTYPVLNNTGFIFVPPTVVQVPIFNFANQTFQSDDHNGFIAYVGFGSRNECVEPPPPNVPPVCVAITGGPDVFIGDSIALSVNATDADGDVLTYTWSSTCGRIVGSGANVTFDATGVPEGTCTITVQISDGFNPPVECTALVINVRPRPNVCPTVTLTASSTSVKQGERVTFTATVTDPDNGPGPVTYEWNTTAGSLNRISDNQVEIDTTGLEGSITVSVTTGDGDPNCVRTERVTVNIEPPPAPEPIDTITPCSFRRNNARVDNACKSILDDVATRMQSNPTLQVVIDGHSDRGERAGIALKRAENVRDYLVNERGIDANRIVVRSYDDKCDTGDAASNRRVEIFLVPEGRTPDEIQKNCAGGMMP